MADGSESNSLIAKIVGGVFATIIAPILVALVTKWTDKEAPPADPAKPDATASAKPDELIADQPNASQPDSGRPTASQPNGVTPGAAQPKGDTPKKAKAGQDKPNPGKPDQLASAESQGPRKGPIKGHPEAGAEANLVRLFNGVDKSGFYTWLGAPKPKGKPIGKNRDPDKQFTVEGGVLHIGGPTNGGLVTEKEFENYELRVRYRWGEQNWPPNVRRARQGGILLHCTGPDGAVFTSAMRSIRCDLTEGEAGCLRAVGSNPKNPIGFTVAAERRNVGEGDKKEVRYRYNPAKALTTLAGGFVNQLDHDPDRENVKGFRGKNTLEKPVGEWNLIECICEGGRITVRLNGTTVNEINDVTQRKGKIMIQALRSEMFIKVITLKPLGASAPKGKR
jgi:hypothetical protein